MPTTPPLVGLARVPPRARRGMLAFVLLIAAALRLIGLTDVPPGLNQDEAANAWNAWCLLNTGQDQAGASWPVFYTRALGENRSALYLYALLPIQAVGGLNVWTTRLPAALAGVASVALLSWVLRRLFGTAVALTGAALLALTPWHIFLSRWGHEASLAPALALGSLAALLWAGLPLYESARPRAWKAALAGLLAGASGYGYPALRIYVPILVAAAFACALLNGRACLRTRAGALALAAYLAGFALLFAPLVYQHLAHPDEIARRADALRLWNAGDSAATAAAKVAARYTAHFGPDFLFLRGDAFDQRTPRGFGALAWYTLPPALLGLGLVIAHARRHAASRFLLLALLLYPVGDILHRHTAELDDPATLTCVHVLRSAAGLWVLTALAALGAVRGVEWLLRRRPRLAWTSVAAFVLLAAVLDGRFLGYLFTQHAAQSAVYRDFHADLVEAVRLERSRIAAADAVVVTTTGMNMPYVVMLVTLGYRPEDWFRDPRDVRRFEETVWDYYERVGKLHFVYDAESLAALRALQENGRPDRILFLMRPGELALPVAPLRTIRGPDGAPRLLVSEAEL